MVQRVSLRYCFQHRACFLEHFLTGTAFFPFRRLPSLFSVIDRVTAAFVSFLARARSDGIVNSNEA